MNILNVLYHSILKVLHSDNGLRLKFFLRHWAVCLAVAGNSLVVASSGERGGRTARLPRHSAPVRRTERRRHCAPDNNHCCSIFRQLGLLSSRRHRKCTQNCAAKPKSKHGRALFSNAALPTHQPPLGNALPARAYHTLFAKESRISFGATGQVWRTLEFGTKHFFCNGKRYFSLQPFKQSLLSNKSLKAYLPRHYFCTCYLESVKEKYNNID